MGIAGRWLRSNRPVVGDTPGQRAIEAGGWRSRPVRQELHPMGPNSVRTHASKIRWGIMGCARISRRGLIPGIRNSSRGTLEALASRDVSVARAWAEEFGVGT